MKILRLLLISLSTFTILVVLILGSILNVVSSGAALNQIGLDSGAYSQIAQEAKTTLGASPRIPSQYQANFATALDKSISVSTVQAILQPALVDISTWLQQPDSTPPPDVILVIKPIKDSLYTNLELSGINGLEIAVFKRELNQQIPDQIRLSSIGSLTGASQASTSNDAASTTSLNSTDQITPTLVTTKKTLTIIRQANMLGWIMIGFFSLALLLLSLKNRRAMLTRPAKPFMIAGAIGCIGSLTIPAILRAVSSAQDSQQKAILSLTGQLFQATVWPALGLLVFGSTVFIVGWLIARQSDSLNSTQLRQPIQRR
ncbi:MAG: hypothetical protein WCI47_03100 [bacterium]